jgi:hypothetical protein
VEITWDAASGKGYSGAALLGPAPLCGVTGFPTDAAFFGSGGYLLAIFFYTTYYGAQRI